MISIYMSLNYFVYLSHYIYTNSLCHCCHFKLGYIDNHGRYARDDSSASDDGGDSQSTVFIIGSGEYLNQTPSPVTTPTTPITPPSSSSTSVVTVTSVPLSNANANNNSNNSSLASSQLNNNMILTSNTPNMTSAQSVSALSSSQNSVERLVVRTHLIYHFINVDLRVEPIQSNAEYK